MKVKVVCVCGHETELEVADTEKERNAQLAKAKERLCPVCYEEKIAAENRENAIGCCLAAISPSLYRERYSMCKKKKFSSKPEGDNVYVFIPYERVSAEAILTVWGVDRSDKAKYDASYQKALNMLTQDTFPSRQKLITLHMPEEKKKQFSKTFDVVDLYQSTMDKLGVPVNKTAVSFNLGESKTMTKVVVEDVAKSEIAAEEKSSEQKLSTPEPEKEQEVTKTETNQSKKKKNKQKNKPVETKQDVADSEEHPFSNVVEVLNEVKKDQSNNSKSQTETQKPTTKEISPKEVNLEFDDDEDEVDMDEILAVVEKGKEEKNEQAESFTEEKPDEPAEERKSVTIGLSEKLNSFLTKEKKKPGSSSFENTDDPYANF